MEFSASCVNVLSRVGPHCISDCVPTPQKKQKKTIKNNVSQDAISSYTAF